MRMRMGATLISCATIVCSLCCTLSQSARCPPSCLCDDTVIDCSNNKLSAVPHIQPQSSALVVNFSSNSLTSLENLQNFPSSQTTLDLSFNQISSIPLNAFNGEQFLELHTLNLTSNLITEVRFVFPTSLQVLRLSRNEIRHFCVERLKNLSQLRTLSLELNGLKTLSYGETGLGVGGGLDKKGQSKEECPFQPLQRIREVLLRGNKLKTLDPAALRCFQNTHFLSLADNSIQSLPVKLFSTFQRLKYLDLSGNHLTHIPGGVFSRLSGLKFLSLARNQLPNVPVALPMLEWLDLSHNAISSVPEAQKSDLYPQEVFLMGGNPLHCDCNLLWLKELFNTREYLLKFIEIERSRFVPICASPITIQGEMWDVLGDESFGCEDHGDGGKESFAHNPTKAGVVRLEDLSFKVRDIGSTHIRLEWDSYNLSTEKLMEGKEPRRIFITCHPFGQRKEKLSAAVQLSLGTHRLKGLQPSTAYVVCISLAELSARSPQAKTSRDDCVEVVTKDDELFNLRDIYIRISLVVLGFVLLMIKCCCTSSLQKDTVPRPKRD